MILGKEAMPILSKAKIAVFGIGGVGSYTAEALARSGIGAFMLFDNDTVSISNINRQIIATTKTIGMPKVEVMKERILDINPCAVVQVFNCFYTNINAADYDLTGCSYIVDTIDTVSSKLLLVESAERLNIPIISSMGAGNKLDPTRFEIADIYETSICPLAKVMRKELRARGIDALKVVYSKEPPITPLEPSLETELETAGDGIIRKRQTPGSVAFVPSVAGLIIAGEVIKDICSL